MDEAAWIHLVTRVVEIVGTAIIVVGSFGALAVFLIRMTARSAPRDTLVAAFRSNLGRSILLGLEFLVAADIINTVAVEPTVNSLIVLAGIVLIRTFLSFSLEVEIEGRWPWQRGGKVGGGEATDGPRSPRMDQDTRSADREGGSSRSETCNSQDCTDAIAIGTERSAASTATRW